MKRRLFAFAAIAAAALAWGLRPTPPAPAIPTAPKPAVADRMTPERAIEALRLPVYADSRELRDTGPAIAYSVPTRSAEIRFGESSPDVTVGDLRLTPILPGFGAPRVHEGRVIYEAADAALIYAPGATGVKEDLVLYAAPRTDTFTWTLDHPETMVSRLLDDGSIGVFAATEDPYQGVTIADHKSAALVARARAGVTHDRLCYRLPPPVVYDAAGRAARASFRFAPGLVSVVVQGLESLTYPVTVDPNVLITTTSDFAAGNNDGNAAYNVAGEVRRATLAGGNLTPWTIEPETFSNQRLRQGGCAFNGYLYVSGGTDGGSWFSDVQVCAIDATGNPGAWTFTTAFTTARAGHAMLAYNGFMFIIGGEDAGGTPLADVQVAAINPDGTLGPWQFTTSLPTGRKNHAATVCRDAIYLVGGETSSGLTNQTLYNVIRPSGALQGWASTASSPLAKNAALVAHLDHVYLVGGNDGTFDLQTVSYARQEPNGTLASWAGTSSMISQRAGHGAAVIGGYLVAFGSFSGNAEMAPVGPSGELGPFRRDLLWPSQFRSMGAYASIGKHLYMIGGDLGGGALTQDILRADMTKFGDTGPGIGGGGSNVSRWAHGAVVWNGFLYILGGHTDIAGTAYTADVSYAAIDQTTGLVPGPWTTSINPLPTGRAFHGVAVWNGRLYVTGGKTALVSTADNVVLYSTLDQLTGANGLWTTTTAMASGRRAHGCFAFNDRLYVVGGVNVGGTEHITAHFASITNTGTLAAWEFTSVGLPAGISHAAWMVNRDRVYMIGGQTGAAVLDTAYVATINLTTGAIGSWSTMGVIPEARTSMFCFVANEHLYIGCGRTTTVATSGNNGMFYAPILANGLLGSWTSTQYPYVGIEKKAIFRNGIYYVLSGIEGGPSTFVDTFALNPNGSIGQWTADTALPAAKYETACAGYGEYVYITGGSAGGTDVLYQKLDGQNRASGSWLTTTALPIPMFYHAAVAHNGFLYVSGGNFGGNSVYYAAINPLNGTLGTWNAAPVMPASLVRQGMFAWNGRMYIVGGNGSTTVYRADIDPVTGDLSSWTTEPLPMLTSRGYASYALNNGFLYAIGGSAGPYLATVEFAAINPGTGAVGPWAQTAPMPFGMYFHRSWAQDGYLYTIGGYNGDNGGFHRYVLRASLSSNGIPGAWQEATYLPIEVYAHGLLAHKGRLWVVGGYNSGAINTVYQAPLFTPAHRAQWSRRLEFNNDKELLNITIFGSAAAKGAVRMRFNASRSAFNHFSDFTLIVPTVPLGTPIALNSQSARYVYAILELDDTLSAAINVDATLERDVTAIDLVYNTQPGGPGLTQLENGGTLAIPTGAGANDGVNESAAVHFQGALTDEDGDLVQFHVDVEPIGTPFSIFLTPDVSSPAAVPGTHTVNLPVGGTLVLGERYHWRGWATDAIGSTSKINSYPSSIPFNTEASIDFYVDRAPAAPTADQFEADGLTQIPIGNDANSGTVIFFSPVSDPDTSLNTLALEIEAVVTTAAFTNTLTHQTTGWPSGATASVSATFPLPVLGIDHHWQARVRDNEGVVSAWVVFGANGDVPTAGKDFKPVNASPPVMSNITQRNQGGAVLNVGDETAGTNVTVEFSVDLADADAAPGNEVKMQIELRPIGVAFTSPTVPAFSADGVVFFETSYATAPQSDVITVVIPSDQRYHWQIRAVDNTLGFQLATPWTPFGGNGDAVPADTDFYVDQTNDAPSVVTVDQYHADGATLLPIGNNAAGVVIRGIISDPNAPNVDGTPSSACKLQLELQPTGTPFTSPANPAIDNLVFFESTVNPGNGVFNFTVPQTAFSTAGSYHWQVRAVDTDATNPLASGWSGPGGDPHFTIVPNGAPGDPAGLDQIDDTASAPIPVGFAILTRNVRLEAVLSDPLSQPVKMQIELRPTNQAFTSPAAVTIDNINFFETSFGAGGLHSKLFTSLVDGSYKWQVRSLNFGTSGTDGIASPWIAFGGNPVDNADFRIEGANDPPAAPTGLTQLTPPDNRSVVVGGVVIGRSVILRAECRDPENSTLDFHFEVATVGTPFTDTPTHAVQNAAPGQPVFVTVNDLSLGGYKWQVRTSDPLLAGSQSAWVPFGGNGVDDVDFSIDATAAINPNAPVTPAQWLPNNSAVVPTGATVAVTGILFKAVVTHPRGEAVRLQIEVKPVGVAFANLPTAQSAFVSAGATAEISLPGLQNGYYRWQCRTLDTRGGSSSWVSYGGNPETTPPDDPGTTPDESSPAVSTEANDFVIDVGVNVRPDIPVLVGQYRDNGVAPIPVGGTNTQGTMVFRAFLTDANGDALRLEVEVKPLGVAFDDRASGIGALVTNGSIAQVTVSGLGHGPYKWRARAVESGGLPSDYAEFGANLETDADFIVNPGTNAAPDVPATLIQLKLDGVTEIPVNGFTSILGLIFSASQSDLEGDTCRIEVEVRPIGAGFADVPTAVGDLSPSGFAGQVSMTGFVDGQSLHWQARITDSTGSSSAWVAYGGNGDPGDPDFTTTTNGIADSGSTRKCGALGWELLIPAALLLWRRRRR